MQGPAIRIARKLGLFAVALDGNPSAPCADMANRFERVDLADREGVEALARSMRGEPGGLAGIMTAGTDFSATAAWVAERLGLPGLPYEAALNATDKGRMRACFEKAGLPSPPHATISAGDDLDALALPAPFPLVVKPVDNMGGRGCRRANDMAELRGAARDALRHSRSGRAIVEGFMDGPEFSVDAILNRGEITICGLADRHVFFPPFFIEMGHTMPTSAPEADREAILETFRAGIRALGLAGDKSVGAAKGDIKMTPEGPMIGEIAARLSGGYMSGWTYPYSSGAEPIRAALLLAAGREPEGLKATKSWTSAERAFISIPGTVKSITGEDAARGTPGVRKLFLRAVAGAKAGFPENNVSKCGNAISAAPSRAVAALAAESAARAVLIRLDPADPETGEFLESGVGGGGFPPDAFQLSPRLRSLLGELPETAAPPGARRAALAPFPEFAESGLRDYMGRTAAESLAAALELTGVSLEEWAEGAQAPGGAALLGRSFWAALARGSYQGAAYVIDRLGLQRGGKGAGAETSAEFR